MNADFGLRISGLKDMGCAIWDVRLLDDGMLE